MSVPPGPCLVSPRARIVPGSLRPSGILGSKDASSSHASFRSLRMSPAASDPVSCEPSLHRATPCGRDGLVENGQRGLCVERGQSVGPVARLVGRMPIDLRRTRRGRVFPDQWKSHQCAPPWSASCASCLATPGPLPAAMRCARSAISRSMRKRMIGLFSMATRVIAARHGASARCFDMGAIRRYLFIIRRGNWTARASPSRAALRRQC